MKRDLRMLTNVIHLIDTLDKINFGIWNAAIFGSEHLNLNYNISTSIWVCDGKENSLPEGIPYKVVFINKEEFSKQHLISLIKGIDPRTSVVVSHGCWRSTSKLAFKLSEIGFKWVYTPHGMLEPWSMNHKWFKKKIYFALLERPMAANADLIRAVSSTEQENLKGLFKQRIDLIENGVKIPDCKVKPTGQNIFLFLSRLHFKKGILPLVMAWNKTMLGSDQHKLIIAGPDEGEYIKIKPFLEKNIEYVGAIYGKQKEDLLRNTHYYLLPSLSEGFPTSVVEAMSFGAIPLVSSYCNFNAVFSKNLGYDIGVTEESIIQVLTKLKTIPFDEECSKNNYNYIKANNSQEFIGEKLYSTYSSVLNKSIKE